MRDFSYNLFNVRVKLEERLKIEVTGPTKQTFFQAYGLYLFSGGPVLRAGTGNLFFATISSKKVVT